MALKYYCVHCGNKTTYTKENVPKDLKCPECMGYLEAKIISDSILRDKKPITKDIPEKTFDSSLSESTLDNNYNNASINNDVKKGDSQKKVTSQREENREDDNKRKEQIPLNSDLIKHNNRNISPGDLQDIINKRHNSEKGKDEKKYYGRSINTDQTRSDKYNYASERFISKNIDAEEKETASIKNEEYEEKRNVRFTGKIEGISMISNRRGSRSIFEKIRDRIVYSQSMSDDYNCFTVIVEEGDGINKSEDPVDVLFYGHIRGGETEFRNGDIIQVRGIRNRHYYNEIYAQSLGKGKNNPRRVIIDRDPQDTRWAITLLGIIITIIILGTIIINRSSIVAFFSKLLSLLTIFIVSSIICGLLVFWNLRRSQMRTRIILSIIGGILITLLYNHAFGIL